MPNHAGWYNPIYDTVQQRRNYSRLLQITEKGEDIDEMFVNLYNGFFRWDLLVLGKVYWTDAQWYDSLFLHKMKDGSQKKFFDLLKDGKELHKDRLLEIRIRENHIKKMFTEDFFFSSAQNESILNAWKKFRSEWKGNSKEIFVKFAEHCSGNNEANRFAQRLQKLMDELVKENGAVYNSEVDICKGNWPKPEINYFDGMWKCLEEKVERLSEGDKDAEEIQLELKGNWPRRSVIEYYVQRLERNLGRVFSDFDKVLIRDYTENIAKSQQLAYVKSYTHVEESAFSKNNAAREIFLLLASLELDAFKSILYDGGLVERRKKWLNTHSEEERSKFYCDLLSYISTKIRKDSGSPNLYEIAFFSDNHTMVVFSRIQGVSRLYIPVKFKENGMTCNTFLHDGGENLEENLEYEKCKIFCNSDYADVYAYPLENEKEKVREIVPLFFLPDAEIEADADTIR